MGVLDDAIREHLELKRQHGASDEDLTRAEKDALGPARRDQVEQADAAPAGEHLLVPDHVEPLPHGDPLADHEPASAEHEQPTEYLQPKEAQPAPEQHDDEFQDGMEPEFAPMEGQTQIGDEGGSMLAGEPGAQAAEESATHEPVAHEPEPEAHATEVHVPVAEEPQLDDNTPSHQGDPFAHDTDPGQAVHEPAAAEVYEVEEQAPAEVYEVEEHPATEEHHVPEEQHQDPAPPASEERNERDDLLEDTPDFLQETPEHDRLWFEQKPPRDFDFDD